VANELERGFQEINALSTQKYGRAIGSHLGKPIYESITDQDVTYIFDRLAECDAEGCPLDQVKRGELLLQPGLIYRQAS